MLLLQSDRGERGQGRQLRRGLGAAHATLSSVLNPFTPNRKRDGDKLTCERHLGLSISEDSKTSGNALIDGPIMPRLRRMLTGMKTEPSSLSEHDTAADTGGLGFESELRLGFNVITLACGGC